VFGAPYSGGCATLAISVDDSGALDAAFAELTYDSSATVHGVAVSPGNDFIYSADDPGNAVWAHSYNSTSGEVQEIQYLEAPTGSDPRHLTVHPSGTYVYVVYEASSEIGVYTRDSTTGKLTYSNTTYPLLPTGKS
jgi:carboxy-cis,cis-muconate cyclase